MHQEGGDSRRIKNLKADLTFLVKILSDFTELPIAKTNKPKKKKNLPVLCFLSNCGCVSEPACKCTCMHVCLQVFPGMHGNKSD